MTLHLTDGLSSLHTTATLAGASEAGAAGLGIFMLLFSCCMIVFSLAVLGFWVWMLVDVCTREFDGNEKLAWILVVVLASWLGALIYFFVGRPKGRKS